MSERVVILGGGVDELVAARKLARAGRQVALIGRSSASPVDGWIAPAVAREAKGLKIDAPDPWASAPLPQGGMLELWRDSRRTVEAIRIARFFEKL